MESKSLQIISYHELPHYSNIYSLSTFDNTSKKGCIISTSKHIYRLVFSKKGRFKITPIKLRKVNGNTQTGEIEIQGVSCLDFKGMVYLAFTCRSRKEGVYSFSLIVMKNINEDLYTVDDPKDIDLDYTPYKIFMVLLK